MRAFSAAVVLCALCAQPALAAPGIGPGVHIDPGSPAAKEYRIPITGARNEASGNSAGSPQSTTAPTFGIGVTAAPSSAAAVTANHRPGHAHPRGDSAGGRADRRRGGHRRDKRRRDATSRSANGASRSADAASRSADASRSARATDRARATVAAEAEVDSISWLPLAAGGALVLLVGCGTGLALRRLR